MKRRTFSRALITTLGLSAIGDKVLLAGPGQIHTGGNKWSEKGPKLFEIMLADKYNFKEPVLGLPVAEDAGVRLKLHPNDPPVLHRGVPRIFSSRKALREINLNGMVVPDHIQLCENSEAVPEAGEAFIFGYRSALGRLN
jgi:hypothetical protein